MRLGKIVFFLLLTNSVFAQNWDIRTLRNINIGRNQGFDNYAIGFSNSAEILAIGAPISMLAIGYAKNDAFLKKQGFNLAATTIATASITYILKKAVNRERPYEKYHDIQNVVTESSGSFPSGSTALAFSTATSISLAYPKWYVIAPAAVYASTVGYSRLHLGVHYPSDVIAGTLIGTGTAFLTHYLNRKLTNYYRKKKLPVESNF